MGFILFIKERKNIMTTISCGLYNENDFRFTALEFVSYARFYTI